MINTRSRVGIIDFAEGDNEDDKIISYCKNCEKYGFKVRLLNRIYPEGEPMPVDHSNFLQCHSCGLIVPIYELEKESSLKDEPEASDNPFDVSNNTILGIDKRTSIGGKNARKKRERQKLLDDINDDDVRREVAKGNTLLSYTEIIPE